MSVVLRRQSNVLFQGLHSSASRCSPACQPKNPGCPSSDVFLFWWKEPHRHRKLRHHGFPIHQKRTITPVLSDCFHGLADQSRQSRGRLNLANPPLAVHGHEQSYFLNPPDPGHACREFQVALCTEVGGGCPLIHPDRRLFWTCSQPKLREPEHESQRARREQTGTAAGGARDGRYPAKSQVHYRTPRYFTENYTIRLSFTRLKNQRAGAVKMGQSRLSLQILPHQD